MPFHRREVILGGNAFVPTQLSGLKLWLAADKLALANGASVATWTDGSANGTNAVQATGARQPTFATGQQGGKPGVQFVTASQQYLTVTFGALFAQPITSFIVGSLTNASGLTSFFYDGIDSSNRVVIYHNSANLVNLFAGSSVAGAAFPTTFNIWEAVYNGAASNLWQNGTPFLTSVNPGAQGCNGFTIGADNTHAIFSTIVVQEFVVYSGVKNAADRARARRYFGTKYGLTVS